MNVAVLVLLLTCSSTAAAPSLGGNAAAGASARTACGPECSGTCFDGNCLFANNDVDGEDSLRTTAKQAALSEAPSPLATSGLAAWIPGIVPQSRSPLQLQQVIPPATATAGLGAIHSVGALENKAQELSFELQRAEAHAALLRAQNEQLRQQLADWKVAGNNIAQREAQVMALVGAPVSQQSSASTAPSASAIPAAAAAVPAVGTQPLGFLQSARQLLQRSTSGYGYLGPLVMGVIVFIVVGTLWKTGCFFNRWRKGEVDWQSVSQAAGQRLKPVLRAMGKVQYKVEISEIHLGSLFAGSTDVRVNFRMGNGVERRTKVLKNAGGSFLRFDDVLELSICGNDSPCTICITDRRGDLAHVELASSQLLRLATRPNQEYFRTELTASREMGDLAGKRPYVAMRMRNISAPPAAAAPMTPRNDREQRAYGSFAV